MQLIALGLNHQSAPLGLRERLAFPGTTLRDGLGELRSSLRTAAPEQALLSTCNRTEMYLAAEKAPEAKAQALDWLAWKAGTPEHELVPHLYQLPDDQAIRHAFRVASGLDSMVLGEPQILGQMKLAAREAHQAGCLGTHLHHLFQQAFSVAKEVRTTTEIGLHSVSMAAASVKLPRTLPPNTQNILWWPTARSAEARHSLTNLTARRLHWLSCRCVCMSLTLW